MVLARAPSGEVRWIDGDPPSPDELTLVDAAPYAGRTLSQSFASNVTLKDVAERASVSQSTVSRTLSHPEKVAPATRARVLEVVRTMNYQPNELARGLKQRNSRIIGLIIADLLNDFHAHIAKGVQDAALEHNLTVMMTSTEEDSGRECRFLAELRRHAFQGLVIVPTDSTRRNLERFPADAVVEVDRASGIAGADVVLAENVEPSAAAVRHLADLGHRRIATIAGRITVTTGRERLEGYRAGMEACGLPVDPSWIQAAERHDEASGFDAAMKLFDAPLERRPTAIFVFNNEVTAGVLRAAKERGLAIPRDLSIVGFDDSRWARLMSPGLTVVAQPAYEMGYLAAERLVLMLERPSVRGTVTRLPTRLIVRESTAPPSSP